VRPKPGQYIGNRETRFLRLTRRREEAMTIDERLEALTRNLELLSLESEKHDRQLDRAAKLITEVAEGTARLLRVVEMHENRLDSHDDRLDKLE
jgi:hypothetical protein